MRKIPTYFERDWNGDRSRVLDQVHAGCEWVAAGEGVATRKIDGTCCLVRDGKMYKRREVKEGQPLPPDFETSGHDDETGKAVGWVPVGDGPDDARHREAFSALGARTPDGTYELIGPKVQGNPEGVDGHVIVRHGAGIAGALENVPRDFGGLRAYLETADVEGVVWHHPDGRMAKIKARDFGIKRSPRE
jgi:hypothetical protein